jgi:GxxExxY protein
MTTDNKMAHEELTHAIIGAFYYVYNRLGYGFLESVYAAALEHVLVRNGHHVAREVRVPVWFEGVIIAYHRVDMIVDHKVIVEIKATEFLHETAARQLLNYLRATKLEVGLLLHFGKKAYRRRLYWQQ